MLFTRRAALASAAATLTTSPLAAQSDGTPNLTDALWATMFGDREEFDWGMSVIAQYESADLVPSVILAQRFSRYRPAWFEPELRRLSGNESARGWFEWMLWQEDNDQFARHPGYADLKRRAFLQIDPNFADFLKPEYLAVDRMKIRLEEITWGGVRKDGIPSLDNPELIAASEATYLKSDDLVFGVSINGDARAYPLRIMGWHEMFNDVIGGVPLALAYCTLCGSGILFETQVAGRGKPLVFGSSGFLYRSNKLMFDR